MIANLQLLEWFRDDSPPAATLPDPAIVIGGTSLLAQFLAIVGESSRGGQLAIATPYITGGVVTAVPAWEHASHRQIDLLVVTASLAGAGACERELGVFPWRSVSLHVRRRLHAKLFAFIGEGDEGACLVGSHNLTAAALKANEEAGVLFVGTRHADMRRLVRACHDQVLRLAAQGQEIFDTHRWPGNHAA